MLALRGDADGAMRALRHAADLGWRESIDAEHDPAFGSLQSRSDFRSLIERTGKDNLQMRQKFSPSAGEQPSPAARRFSRAGLARRHLQA